MRRTLSFLLALMLLICTSAAMAEEIASGARGDEVQAVQVRLVELGYLSGEADGIYGKQTDAAVKFFQEAHDLEVTGTVSVQTKTLLFSEDVKALRPGLEKDDEGDAVLTLQERLIFLGFLDDEADGKYGKKTQNAVEAFQKNLIAQGIEAVKANGNATPITQEFLFNAARSTYVRDLQPGDEGSEVQRAERRLLDLGYLDAKPDDEYDDYAVSAVKAFQKTEALYQTGKVDKETMDVLFSGDAQLAERFVAHDIQENDTGSAVVAVQERLAQYGMFAAVPDGKYGTAMSEALDKFYEYLVENGSQYAEYFAQDGVVSAAAQDVLEMEDFFVYHDDVKSGASSSEVLRVQRRLHSLFYIKKGNMTGKFGDVTKQAVKDFQSNNRLNVTGEADEATLRALFSAEAVGEWTKYMVKISIDDQRVYVYGLNSFGEYELDHSFICSTGLGSTTPRGIFLSTRPLNRWHYFKKFECWAQYSHQIEGDILFHSVLYSERSESTLRYGSVYALGHKASHGCVRLKVEDAKWIYENCETGTVMVVY